jgi:hypothetical protein
MPRMQTCTTCRHPQRASIDKALLAGEAERSIAKRFAIHASNIHRHKASCIGKVFARAVRAKAARDEKVVLAFEHQQGQFGNNLVAELQRLAAEAADIGAKAKHAKQYGAAMGGIREMARIVELIAKLTGQLDESARVNVLVAEREQREASQVEDLSRLDLTERLQLARLLSKVRGLDEPSALAISAPNSMTQT